MPNDESQSPRESGEIRQALEEIQAEARKLIPRDVSLVDELIAERRRDAAREEASELAS